jgi:hypothetical protein
MKISFRHPSVSADFDMSDDLAGFFVWLAANRLDGRAKSILLLIAEHDAEKSGDERANIRRTVNEILENAKI